MRHLSQKIVIIFLVSIIALGAAASGTAGIKACPAKACHNSGRTLTVVHDDPGDALYSCIQRPCCRLKPIHPRPHAAIMPRFKLVAHPTVIATPVKSDALSKPQVNAGRTPIHANGSARAPLVPIYLQNLAILC